MSNNAMHVDIVTTALMSMNMDDSKEFLRNLRNNGIDVDVIIQDLNEDNLRVSATRKMKDIISVRYQSEEHSEYLNSIEIEEFDYGA